ncbi:SDR family oxidoreductase [Neobacillus pocheonensis]|uniref:SDR family oxidoreductase n=1 Tax=Neobacillus pocheonensis TaxID=363869 RepID=A0ABT0WDR5_9BACI|nr:SDR family oxidoreductase [Neobacillus pocheonensis]
MSKTALITGATSGLGYEFVKLFAADGYNLVLVARNKQKLEEIKQSFRSIDVRFVCKDLSVPNAAKEVFEEIEEQGIYIDVLVNNAGFGLLGNFDELDIQKQVNMIQLNITALTELTYYLLPKMKQKHGGKIINVASTAAFQPGPLMAVYYATKAYVLSFSEALVEEVSDIENSITVTTLCPGPTKTNFGSVANVEGTKMFSNAMNSDIVAKQGYEAMKKGKRVVVTGGMNRVGVFAAKFLPRSTAAKMAKFVAGKK